MKQQTIGDVSRIESDKKLSCWTLANVRELISGKSGHSSFVKIKTEDSELLRPIQKNYNLDIPKELSLDPLLRTRNVRTVTVPKLYKT